MMTNAGTVLVVDDDQHSRTLLAASLEEAGYRVELAEGGLAALELLRAQPIDVVLLDLAMPAMDGEQVLEHMKADAQLRHIPVIIIAASDELDSVVRCIEMGATDYLPKPFNPVLLRARISASLASKRLRDLEHLEQVGRAIAAAGVAEAATFEHARPGHFQRTARGVPAPEERQRLQVRELHIVIDEARQEQKVAEIIESDDFRLLRSQADLLRSIINGIS